MTTEHTVYQHSDRRHIQERIGVALANLTVATAQAVQSDINTETNKALADLWEQIVAATEAAERIEK